MINHVSVTTKLLILTITIFSFSCLKGQKNGKIYLKDSSVISDKIYFNKKVPYKIGTRSNKKEKIRTLSPDEVNYFILSNGDEFRSKKIQVQGDSVYVFLQLLIDGDCRLYKLREAKKDNKYFIERIRLEPLLKSTYQEQLYNQHSSCNSNEALKRVRFNTAELIFAVRSVNQNDCKKFKSFSTGLTAALSNEIAFFKLGYVNDNIFETPVINDFSHALGVFFILPFWSSDRLNITFSTTYNHRGFSKALRREKFDQNFFIKMRSLQFIPGIEYIMKYGHRHQVFLNAGIIQEINIDSESSIFYTEQKLDRIVSNQTNNVFELDDFFHGLKVGAGARFYYSGGHYLSLTLSTSHLLSNNSININQQSATLGFNIF